VGDRSISLLGGRGGEAALRSMTEKEINEGW